MSSMTGQSELELVLIGLLMQLSSMTGQSEWKLVLIGQLKQLKLSP